MNSTLKSSIALAALVLGVGFGPNTAFAQSDGSGKLVDGAICTADNDCVTKGATCTAPATPPGAAKVCTPATPPPTKKSDGEACAADVECASGFCEGGKCTPQGDNGTKCKRPEACSSGVCVKDLCVECASDGDCGNGKVCTSNACVTKPGSVADGDACTADADCASGDCVDSDADGTEDKCAPKAAAPVVVPPVVTPPTPVAPPVVKSTVPACPAGFVATEFPPASGSYVCIPSAPQPTAPVPVQPAAPISLETVCGSFPLSDPTSSDSFDRIAGCIWMATAQACGTSRTQFWGDCAIRAQELSKGKTGNARVQSFFTKGLGLIVEKYGNRLSGRYVDAAALAVLTADAKAFAAALKGQASQGDLLRLALGTVTAGSRAPAARHAAASPRCEAGWTLLATTKSPVFGSKTGAWLCHRSGEEGPGSWAEPSYGPAPVAPVPPTTAIPPSTSSR